MSAAAGDLVNQRSGASPPQARGTGGRQGSAQQHPESGQWNWGADWDPTEDILFYRPLAVPKVPEEGGKVGKRFPCVCKIPSRSGPFLIKIRTATPLKSVVSVTTQNSVYNKSAEMSIPTHTELATSCTTTGCSTGNESEAKCKIHTPGKFLPSVKGNTKWKLLLSGKRNLLHLRMPKTAGILGFGEQEDRDYPTSCRTSRNGANSFKWVIPFCWDIITVC